MAQFAYTKEENENIQGGCKGKREKVFKTLSEDYFLSQFPSITRTRDDVQCSDIGRYSSPLTAVYTS